MRERLARALHEVRDLKAELMAQDSRVRLAALCEEEISSRPNDSWLCAIEGLV